MDTKNISGKNNLYIDDTRKSHAVSYSVDGVCSQDGTPIPDSPVEVKTIPSIINLFDKDNANIINCSMSSSAIANTSQARMIYIPITGGKTYTISKIQSSRFRVATTQTTPAAGVTISNYSSSDGSTAITVNTSSTAKYLCAFIYLSTVDTLTPEEIINTIMIEEGSVAHEYVPYGYWSKVKVTGKNMLDFSRITLSTVTGLTSDLSNNILSLNGTPSASGYLVDKKPLYIKLKAGTYTYSSKQLTGTFTRVSSSDIGIYIRDMDNASNIAYSTLARLTQASGDYSETFTLLQDTNIGLMIYNNGSTVFDNLQLSIQLEQGGTASTFEPYKEKEALVDMSKLNLIDLDSLTFRNGYYSSTGSWSNSNLNGTVEFIEVSPSTIYTITKNTTTQNITISEFDNTQTFIKRTIKYDTSVGGDNVVTLTTDANTKYLAITINYDNSSTTVTKAMLERYDLKLLQSNNPTPYHELSKIGDYKDTLSIDSSGNCVINKNVGKVVLNGGESWSGGSFQSSYRYKITINNATTPSANDLNIYSNYFHASSNVFDTNITTGEIAHYKSTKDFYFSTSQTSAANFKTWLSTHNTEVYYILNTPEKITLKNTPLPLFSGINHITFVDDFETDTTLVYENDISPSDKQALIDGTATIQTKIEVHSENLFEPFDATFNNNITFTYSIDGYINCNGTTTATAYSMTSGQAGNYLISLPSGTYTISGGTSDIDIHVVNSSGTVLANTSGTATFTLSQTTNVFVRAAISSGKTLNNVKVYPILEEGTMPVLTETNSVIDWNHEDFRQVKDEGFIGQFVARQVTGNLHNLSDDFKITDKELELKLGVRTNDNTNWYSLGNFLTTKVTDDEVGDKTSFEALDYTKKFNKPYEDRMTYPCTALTLAKDVCDQCGVELGNFDFKNHNFVIEGNYFTNNESCRDVMKAIGKLAFSWVRCDWDNKVYIDFDPTPFTTNQIPESCDTIGNNKYYNLKTQKEIYGPVDKVVIGYSAIEGERTYIGDENGQCVLTIYDNPLIYNQELRARIINSASDLLGLTYTPLNTQTVGHPWLRADEPIKINDMENVSHITMPLDRTIQYFGHIKTLIDSTTPTKVDDNLSYKPEMVKNYERSEIYNDQNNKQIGIIIEEQSNTNTRLNDTVSTLDGTIQRVSRTETNIQDIVTTTQNSKGGNHLYLEEASQSNALSYSVDGATEQQTYSGKNLCGVPDQTFTHNNVTVTIKDGEITLNGTANATSTKWIEPIKTTTINGNYVNNCIYISGTAPSTNPANFNVRKSDGTIIQGTQVNLVDGSRNAKFSVSEDTSIIYGIYVQNSTTYTNYTFKPQLVAGTSEDYNWEKYVGETPSPNPDYPQEVKTIPSIMNLLDKDNANIINGYLADGGTFVAGNSNRTLYIQCKNNTTYTISKIAGAFFRVAEFTNIPAGGSSWITRIKNETASFITFTTTTGNYLAVSYYNVNGDTLTEQEILDSIMIEKSSIVHEYVPYGYWSKVKVTGKNIFNGIVETNGWSFDVGQPLTKTTNANQLRCVDRMEVNPNTTYVFSLNGIAVTENVRYIFVDKNNIVLSTIATTGGIITTPANCKYLVFHSTALKTNYGLDLPNPMVEQNSQVTPYEPYKENQVLIDMSKENLFDSVNANKIENAYINGNTGVITQNTGSTCVWINCQSNTTYTISKMASTRFKIGTYTSYEVGTSATNYTGTNTGTQATITSGASDNYLIVWYYNASSDTLTEQEIRNSIKIYESNNPTPYYELCKIGDYKDTLSIDSSGDCVINKNVGKVVLNGGENGWEQWTSQTFTNTILCGSIILDRIPRIGYVQMSNYFTGQSSTMWATDVEGVTVAGTGTTTLRFRINKTTASDINAFKTWLSTHNTDVYYVLATPETITLQNTKIPLFEGINHVTFVDDLETDTSISFYRQTPLTGTYATMSQLNDVSVEKTTEIQTVRKELLFEVSNERVRINAINETIDESGVPIVKTDTGYTFDIDGMKIEKSENDVSTIVDNDGLAVSYKTTEILTARSSGVEAENITTRKFYVQKPIRMEKTKSISDGSSVGLGFFYVGE